MTKFQDKNARDADIFLAFPSIYVSCAFFCHYFCFLSVIAMAAKARLAASSLTHARVISPKDRTTRGMTLNVSGSGMSTRTHPRPPDKAKSGLVHSCFGDSRSQCLGVWPPVTAVMNVSSYLFAWMLTMLWHCVHNIVSFRLRAKMIASLQMADTWSYIIVNIYMCI